MDTDWYKNQRHLWEMKEEEARKLKEFSDALDAKIEEDLKKERKPKPEEIIKEKPPLPELDVIKFAMERGNDEIALWLRQGQESGFLDETMIGIALMRYNCPMVYEPEYSCIFESGNSWKDLFHHFKNIHYNEDANIRHAKHLFYDHLVRTFINDKTTLPERKRVEREAENPTELQLKPYLEHVEKRLKWRDTAYAMLQECFVYEANRYGHSNSPKAKKRAAVLYRFQKVYGLTTKQITKIFKLPLSDTRKLIYSGMMYEHGNSEKNLPKWMQNALKF